RFAWQWYDKVLPIAAGAQVRRGGNIILTQLCNEIGMIHWLHKASDPAPFVTDLYRKFLAERYETIPRLNAAYRSGYKNFDEIVQPQGEPDARTAQIFFDWALFYRRYYALYFQSLYKRAKAYGLEV